MALIQYAEMKALVNMYIWNTYTLYRIYYGYFIVILFSHSPISTVSISWFSMSNYLKKEEYDDDCKEREKNKLDSVSVRS